MAEAFGGLFASVFFIIWLGLIIFLISLAIRFVRSIEEIASRSGETNRILIDLVQQIKKQTNNKSE